MKKKKKRLTNSNTNTRLVRKMKIVRLKVKTILGDSMPLTCIGDICLHASSAMLESSLQLNGAMLIKIICP